MTLHDAHIFDLCQHFSIPSQFLLVSLLVKGVAFPAKMDMMLEPLISLSSMFAGYP